MNLKQLFVKIKLKDLINKFFFYVNFYYIIMVLNGVSMKNVSLYPADLYQVIDKSLLSETDRLVLNMLYMPIIGSTAVSLYLKLQSEAKDTFIS